MVIICWVIVCWCIINCLITSIIECFSERFIILLFGGAVFCGTCWKSCASFACAPPDCGCAVCPCALLGWGCAASACAPSGWTWVSCLKWQYSSPLEQPPGSFSFLQGPILLWISFLWKLWSVMLYGRPDLIRCASNRIGHHTCTCLPLMYQENFCMVWRKDVQFSCGFLFLR